MAHNERYENMSDHDLLIELNVKQDGLEKQFGNHLHHHWMFTITALSAAFTAALGFVTSLVLLIVKSGMFKGL